MTVILGLRLLAHVHLSNRLNAWLHDPVRYTDANNCKANNVAQPPTPHAPSIRVLGA